MLTFQTDFQSERIAVDQRVAVNDTYIIGTYLCCCCTISLFSTKYVRYEIKMYTVDNL